VDKTIRMTRLGIAAAVALTLAACGRAPVPQPQAWTGTTAFGGSVQPLHVDVTLDGTDWSGTYTIGSTPPFTGDVVAELVDGVLTGQLVATSTCTFDLAGTVTDAALEAAFTPGDCPGGDAGTWSATPTTAAAGE
jgi:hypothetical protein